MPLLNWYKMYSVNNEEIDGQHKKLFSLFNKLHDICVGKDKVSSFDSVIDELVSYVNYHFDTEENYMRAIGYNDIDKQIADHKYFRQKATDLMQKNDKYDLVICHELIVFLSKWILHHVIEEDKKISRTS